MLLIGSHALSYYLPNSLGRKCMDYDLIATYEQYERWIKGKKFDYLMPHNGAKKMVAKNKDGIFEFEIAWPGSSAEALFNGATESVTDTLYINVNNIGMVHVPTLDFLYMMKMSHRFLKNSPHFLKTMNDIKLMKEKGAHIPDQLKEWFKAREKETYYYKHPNLNQGKMGFFDPNQGVQYVYDHDSIHQAMAHLELPAYSYYKKDNEEVSCDKEKFFSLDEKYRLYGVIEEAYVLALERSQIPFKDKVTPEFSFNKALEKVCTSITSGWFRAWAYDNYDKVKALYNPKYVNQFWQAVETGIVKTV